MSAMDSLRTYHLYTGAGLVVAAFPPEGAGIALDGPPDAVELVRDLITRTTDIDGIPLAPDRIEPYELEAVGDTFPDLLTIISPPDLDAK